MIWVFRDLIRIYILDLYIYIYLYLVVFFLAAAADNILNYSAVK